MQQMTTPALGSALTVALIAFTAVFCWRARRAQPGSRPFSWTLALVLTTTVAIVPMLAPYNHVLLLPPIMLLAADLSSLWRRGFALRLGLAVVGLAIAWPWIASLSLLLARFFLPPAKVESAWTLPLYSMLTIPLAVLALVLYPGFRAGAEPAPTPSSKRPAAASYTPS